MGKLASAGGDEAKLAFEWLVRAIWQEGVKRRPTAWRPLEALLRAQRAAKRRLATGGLVNGLTVTAFGFWTVGAG